MSVGREERVSAGACVWSTRKHTQMSSCYINSTPHFVLGSSTGDQLVRAWCSSQEEMALGRTHREASRYTLREGHAKLVPHV